MKDICIDELGNKYGKWTVIERSHNPSTKGRLDVAWICQCECGNIRTVSGGSLRQGSSKSCGCNRYTDKSGKRFKNLLVLGRDKENSKYYICECSCGAVKSIKGSLLQEHGNTVGSCGCLGRIKSVQLGNVFGNLTVIDKIEDSSNLYRCKCRCGNEVNVRGYSLLAGRVSCRRGCINKILPGQSAFNLMYGQMKKSARVRGYSWELTKEQVKELTQKTCYYCGNTPSRSADTKHRLNGDYIYNGLDRVDNNTGYIIDNVVPCCWKCNKAKATLTSQEFRDIIVEIYNHWASH